MDFQLESLCYETGVFDEEDHVVSTPPDVKKLFRRESYNTKIAGVVVREVKILDQYSDFYEKSISKYKAPKSICGYVVSAVAPLLGEWAPYLSTKKDLDEMFDLLNDPSIMVPKVEEAMEMIQSQRSSYLLEFSHEFKNKKEREKYMNDWVANYEISDVLQIQSSSQPNVFFLRYNSFEFPDLVTEVKHEERRRLKEEEPFKGKRFMVESFNQKRVLENVEQFTMKKHAKELSKFDKPMIFVGDLKGHYVTFMACSVVDDNGNIQDCLILLNSTVNNYAGIVSEVIFTLCQLCFPESMK